ncbi:MAG TPA: MBL fold metallo-hydrolase [Candidatus Polarisedimenticolaceae bacterium]|nr:MBL fold metallo-hydrolase [Candidatus Polarisedimenticolaceae bacterium]
MADNDRRSPRRRFLAQSMRCAGWLIGGLSLAPAAARCAFAAVARDQVVAEEPFARVERVADGVWAVVSTPLKDGGRQFATTSNGGIIAGREAVVIVEGYYSEDGAAWVARQARELTGREPTHAVVTHYHADHTRGLDGLRAGRDEGAGALSLLATATTRELLVETEEPVVPDNEISAEGAEIDLGGRRLRLVPRLGHTRSDVTVHLDEPQVVWCGDLVWNGMFPNYVDAVPSLLTEHCAALLGRRGTTYVPGHGDVADAGALDDYLALIRDLEAAGRRAVEQGLPPAEAAAAYRIPQSIERWTMFSPTYVERAFEAWQRELGGTDASAGSRVSPPSGSRRCR